MNRSELVESLEQFRVELAQAEERAQLALAEADALRKIVEGIEGLVDGRSVQLPLRNDGITVGNSAVRPSNGSAPRPTPRGKQAVRAILSESPRPRKVESIASEVIRRGWIEPEAKHPAATIQNALRRLVIDGVVERVGHGMYRLAPGQLLEGGAEDG